MLSLRWLACWEPLAFTGRAGGSPIPATLSPMAASKVRPSGQSQFLSGGLAVGAPGCTPNEDQGLSYLSPSRWEPLARATSAGGFPQAFGAGLCYPSASGQYHGSFGLARWEPLAGLSYWVGQRNQVPSDWPDLVGCCDVEVGPGGERGNDVGRDIAA